MILLRRKRLGPLARRASVALLLLSAAAAGPPLLAQDDSVKALSEEYARLEREGLQENFHRQLSYQMLLPYLPPGTRMTSGYRSPVKQLELIGKFARAKGVAVPERMTLEDENSWRPALMAIRARGIIIAAPTTTPHGTEEAVFDLSGADLGAIQEGLRKAEKLGMVKYKRIIMERQNNAVHVEVDYLSPKALKALVGRSSSAGGGAPSAGGGGATSAPSEDEQRRVLFRQMQDLHDSEPDPLKKIDYDRSLRSMLDPAADAEKIRALDEEIAGHEKEAEQLGAEGSKKEALGKLSAALREGRFDDAEREAEEFAANFPRAKEARSLLARIRARRYVNEAAEKIETPGCESCREAEGLIKEALALSPRHQQANRLKEDVAACLSQCKARPVLAVVAVLFGLVCAGSLAGWFLLSRPGNWFSARLGVAPKLVLEGVEGPCRGMTFPLDKERVVIGSKAPPEGTADIVINDDRRKISRQHCSITRSGNQFYLVDESTNGTKINGYQIAKGATAVLNRGDQISLADVAVLRLTQK